QSLTFRPPPEGVAGVTSGTEVVVRVGLAARVEGCSAFGAAVDRFVRLDCQFGPAVPAQNGGLIELLWWPLLCVMIRRLRMAQVARIVAVAAGEADGDDIEFGGVVDAPSVIIDRRAEDLRGPRHCSPILPAYRD